MKLKKRSLLNSRLYLILDRDSCPQGNVEGIFRQVCKIGIDLVQLRENTASDRIFLKDAKIIKQLSGKRDIIFLVNNRLDIAQLSNADGVHLGQSDLPLSIARGVLGKDKIIGISCHNLTQALNAEAQGADYISIGPIFSTQTKPKLKPINLRVITTIKRKIKIPFFAIGGIDHSNIRRVMSFGAKRVTLCRAICCAQNIKKATLELKRLLNSKEQ